MTEPTIEEMSRACCEHAGIEVVGSDCPEGDCPEGASCTSCAYLPSGNCPVEFATYPTGTELVEQLKAWLVEQKAEWESGMLMNGADDAITYFAVIYPWEDNRTLVNSIPTTEHEAFIRAFYSAFCKGGRRMTNEQKAQANRPAVEAALKGKQ